MPALAKLDEVSDPQLFESGIWRSEAVDVLKAPLWIDGLNVDFRNGRVEKARGWEDLATHSAAINALAQARVGLEKRAYFGSSGALHRFVDGQEIYPIRTSGLTSGGFWSLIAWGNTLLASQGLDQIQFWQNAGEAESLTDGPLTADIILPLNIHIVALNADGQAGRVEFCDGGNPLVWTPTLENSAGGFNIRNVNSKLTGGVLFGGSIMAFTLNQAFQIPYVGGNTIITYRDLAITLGAAGKNCVVVADNLVYGLDSKGFWRTDGVQASWIAEPMTWDFFKGRIDFERGDEIVAFYNRKRGTVEWHWPIVGGGFEGYAYNLKNQQWSPRDYGLTAAMGDGVFGEPVAADGTNLRLMNSGVDKGSSPMEAFVQTKPLALASTDVRKFVEEIRLRKSGSALLTIGLQESPDDVIEWMAPETLAERHYPNRDTVFLTLKFSSSALGADWSVSAFEFFGNPGGSRS